jgi:GNAT superfamily N-acetyltransferase
MTIELHPLSEQLIPRVLRLTVQESQRPYTSEVSVILKLITPCQSPHIITLMGIPIGFFVIDTDCNLNMCVDNLSTVSLRSFFIDQHHQNRGHAKAALTQLPTYIRRQHPNIHTINLTVNCSNKNAYYCYLSAGFNDTRHYYLDGPVGPQHIMQFQI